MPLSLTEWREKGIETGALTGLTGAVNALDLLAV
jgi:hypothetical protein